MGVKMGVEKDNSFAGGNVSGRTIVHFNSPCYSTFNSTL